MPSKLLGNYLPELRSLWLHRKGPGKVSVNLTSRCNQHCIYCEIGNGTPPDHSRDLTFEDLLWIIGQMAGAGIRKLSLCGGEPFLFDRLPDLVAEASRKGIHCAITSNGMTIHRSADEVFRILRDAAAEINLSVDSFDEETNTLTRGTEAALPNALLSLKRLAAEGIPVTVLTVVTKYNYHDLGAFVASADERGIRQVLFQPVIRSSNYPGIIAVPGKESLNVPPEGVETLLKEFRKILRYESRHLVRTNVYRLLPWIASYLETAAGRNGKWFWEDLLGRFHCREAEAIIDITFDGGIQPCGLANATASIRDNRELGLVGLWELASSALREQLSRNEYLAVCNSCCHHFSRNMLASLVRYPARNRKAISVMLPLIMSRLFSGIGKRIYQYLPRIT